MEAVKQIAPATEGIQPGIYEITNEAYHSSKGISKSGICEVLKSPSHYYAKYLDPERVKVDSDNPAFTFGSGSHKAVLEPDDFLNEYVVLPSEIAGLNKNTKAYKKFIDAMKVQHPGKTIISPDQYSSFFKLKDVVYEHQYAGHLVQGGKAEQSLYWLDPDTGVLCKCRPDYWIPGLAIPDLKTTVDARQSEFARSCAKFHYHIQAAFYQDGVAELTGEHLPMPFIAVEKEPPFAVGVFQIDAPDVSYGRSEYKRALETVARCFETDTWPGYPPQVQVISLPAWSRK